MRFRVSVLLSSSFSCDRHPPKVVPPQGHGLLQFQSSQHSARHTVNACNVKPPSTCLKCGEICQGHEALEMHHANRHSGECCDLLYINTILCISMVVIGNCFGVVEMN